MAKDITGGVWRKQFAFRGCHLDRIAKEVEDLRRVHRETLEEFEVCRMIWEMSLAGKKPTEIHRTLKSGPSWQWRSRRQIEDIVRPGSWRIETEVDG